MMFRNLLLEHVFPALYRHYARSPLKPNKVLFLEHTETSIDQSFQMAYDTLHAMEGTEIAFASTHGFGSAINQLQGYARVIRDIANSRVVMIRSSSFLISALPIRPETTVVQLWHACGAFKRFGMSIAGTETGPDLEETRRRPLCRHVSLVTVSSEDVVWAYEEAFQLQDHPGIVQPLGISRTDAFFREGFVECARKRVLEEIPGIAGRKVILYAPTFRGEGEGATAPDALDITALKEALNEEYALVVKHHPIVKDTPPIPAGCDDFAFNAPSTVTINELMCAANVCITDYSSIIFEWSLFERPIAFFAYDLDEYLDERGFYYDYRDMTPGPVCKTTQELVEWLQELGDDFDASEISAFRKRFMGACDGRATERIISAALGTD